MREIRTRKTLVKAVVTHTMAGNALLPWDDSRREVEQLGAVGEALQKACK